MPLSTPQWNYNRYLYAKGEVEQRVDVGTASEVHS